MKKRIPLLLTFLLCLILSRIYDPLNVPILSDTWKEAKEAFNSPFASLIMYGVGDQFKLLFSAFSMADYFAGEYASSDEVIMYLNGLIVLLGGLSIYFSQKAVERVKITENNWFLKCADKYMLSNVAGYLFSVLGMWAIRLAVKISPLELYSKNAPGIVILLVIFGGAWVAITLIFLIAAYCTILVLPATAMEPLIRGGIIASQEMFIAIYSVCVGVLIFFLWCGFLQDRVEWLSEKIIWAPVKVPMWMARKIRG